VVEAEVPVDRWVQVVVELEVAEVVLEVVLHKMLEVAEQQDKVLMVGTN
jgi:hypothetical protein